MKVLILGAAGMIGRKLVERIAADLHIFGGQIESLILADVATPPVPSSLSVIATPFAADLTQDKAAERLVTDRPDLIFHLAAIVSGEAEADFDKGYRINLDGTRLLFEAIRREGLVQPYRPRVVFTSSIAVFGAPLPPSIGDDFHATPHTSYGTQKAVCELLLADYSRRGFLNGIAIRLPTICVRPGRPNAAASGFFSGIIREPLIGSEAVLPVDESVRHWFASPRSAVGFLVHAARLDLAALGQRRSLNMPGLSVTVGEQLDALSRVAGQSALRLIRREPDIAIERIIRSWPADFDARAAIGLGFSADEDFDSIVRAHIDDELQGRIAPF